MQALVLRSLSNNAHEFLGAFYRNLKLQKSLGLDAAIAHHYGYSSLMSLEQALLAAVESPSAKQDRELWRITREEWVNAIYVALS